MARLDIHGRHHIEPMPGPVRKTFWRGDIFLYVAPSKAKLLAARMRKIGLKLNIE